ncbi:MAG: serine/threonine protein kinase [Polyangiaceae bacterium]|nr:serine/threonine protein kinase [Polyangiaceae bacterium]
MTEDPPKKPGPPPPRRPVEQSVPPSSDATTQVFGGRPSGEFTEAVTAVSPGLELPGPSELRTVTITPSASLHDAEISSITRADGTPVIPKADPYIGCTIDGRYKVESVLGEGGMGVVYQCRHTIIGKKVAMKVLRADLARDREVTERFLNEAKSASAIGNAHIIDISDFGVFPDGSTYFVMEYLDGIPLTKLVDERQPVPVARILVLARQLAEGLSAAHASGIVHRDLKPDNIFLIERGQTKDFIKILDFGIAKVSTGGEGKLTRAGAVFGTPHYMSPEQAAGAPVDHRGDIYSFGVILYELASGKVPFDADNFMGILTQHMYKAPVPIRALVPAPQEIPPGLEAIVLKCLSKRPEQRYQTMQELLEDLDRLTAGAIPSAVPEMMNRSGGFNVPADYFKKGAGMPAPVPASPLELGGVRSKWPLLAGVAGVLTAMLIVILIFAAGSESTASSGAQEASASPPPSAELPPPPPGKKQVVLAVEPIDAKVFRGDEDLGSVPVVLELGPGETASIRIEREGYTTQSLDIDDTQGRRSIRLEVTEIKPTVRKWTPGKPVAKPPPEKPSTGGKPKPKPAGGDPSIVNPWGE